MLKKRKLSYNEKIKPLKDLKNDDSSKYSEPTTPLLKQNFENLVI
jgi:hypothetical protein